MKSNEKKLITKKIKAQIITIRDSGLTNMFATNTVQRLAFDEGFYELVCFIQDHRNEYVNFILYGDKGE